MVARSFALFPGFGSRHSAPLFGAIQAQYTLVLTHCGAAIQMLFKRAEAAPPVICFVSHTRHRGSFSQEKFTSLPSAFLRMRVLVAKATEQGKMRRIARFVASAMRYSGTICRVCLR